MSRNWRHSRPPFESVTLESETPSTDRSLGHADKRWTHWDGRSQRGRPFIGNPPVLLRDTVYPGGDRGWITTHPTMCRILFRSSTPVERCGFRGLKEDRDEVLLPTVRDNLPSGSEGQRHSPGSGTSTLHRHGPHEGHEGTFRTGTTHQPS